MWKAPRVSARETRGAWTFVLELAQAQGKTKFKNVNIPRAECSRMWQ